jgi:hypothetical protein
MELDPSLHSQYGAGSITTQPVWSWIHHYTASMELDPSLHSQYGAGSITTQPVWSWIHHYTVSMELNPSLHSRYGAGSITTQSVWSWINHYTASMELDQSLHSQYGAGSITTLRPHSPSIPSFRNIRSVPICHRTPHSPNWQLPRAPLCHFGSSTCILLRSAH